MSKVFKSIKKFSSRRLSSSPGTGEFSPRLTQQIEEDKELNVSPSKKPLKKSGQVIVKKERKDELKKKDDKRRRKTTKTADNVQEGTSTERRRRRVRKLSNKSEDVGRENETTSAQSEVPMEQNETWEVESVTHASLEMDYGNDFVGSYDFKAFRETEENAVDFSCLSPEEIITAQKKQIQHIADLLVVSASNASNLLRHYHWKTEVLLAKYFDDPQSVIKEAGLVSNQPDADLEAVLDAPGECLVCCEICEAHESCALLCEHRFCADCWSSYLTMKITEGEVTRINCPA